MDFASIRVITHDVDRLVGFYERVTGIAAVRPAPAFAEIRTGVGTLAIAAPETVAGLGAQAPRPSSNSSVIIELAVEDVDDVDHRFEQFRDTLEEIVLEPTTMPWGNRSALFRDPDGNLVNVFARPRS
ncbi:VOC family protein [Cellulomonas sp. PhB143]|uniref:VOC family protein n=1 Tax=Cellulomonas sp. PhB143 TaxID=2485186 RepID=UPI000F475624|nr:VOC family protein [Cellulomonas sp. PhB143]ROS78922.1 putative enzyme related to lactoylglutathione lyase [Cellulomonas sp. PhB143]